MKDYSRPCVDCSARIGAKDAATIRCRSCFQNHRWKGTPRKHRRQRQPDDFAEQIAMLNDFRQGSAALLAAIRQHHPERLAA